MGNQYTHVPAGYRRASKREREESGLQFVKRKPFGRWGTRKKRAVQAAQGEEIEMEMVQEVFYGSDHGDHEEIEIEMEVFHDNVNEHDVDGEEAIAFTLALWLWCLTRFWHAGGRRTSRHPV